MAPVSTPCNRICLLDRTAGLCRGCGRTPDEIGRWSLIGEPERLEIMAGLRSRLRAAYPADLPDGQELTGSVGSVR
ncbi:DUF1289 domain-containing protein [uncultured Enterovirga sp.]|uniref:DUF1289 domain-containing protein n=1 Tax=uncultured Enterovirga sp. TaxID=2026352 RepID=UPI0035CAC8CC